MLNTFTFSSTVTIAYRESGEGRPLLLLHGFGASKETWFDIEPTLAQQYRLIMIDLKGFGDSSKPADHHYGIPDQAQIISSFIRSLNLQNLTLIGHSYGGSIALLTYLTLKEEREESRLMSLVIIDGPAFPQDLPFFISTLQTPVLNWFVQTLVPATIRAKYTLERIFYDKSRVTPDRVERYAKYFNVAGAHHSMIAAAQQIVPADKQVLAARLSQWQVRTLIVWGDKDPVIPLWQAERIAKEIPESHVVLIPNCGHVPHEEKPEQFIKAMSKFLE